MSKSCLAWSDSAAAWFVANPWPVKSDTCESTEVTIRRLAADNFRLEADRDAWKERAEVAEREWKVDQDIMREVVGQRDRLHAELATIKTAISTIRKALP